MQPTMYGSERQQINNDQNKQNFIHSKMLQNKAKI